jgi:hypothetical protein
MMEGIAERSCQKKATSPRWGATAPVAWPDRNNGNAGTKGMECKAADHGYEVTVYLEKDYDVSF